MEYTPVSPEALGIENATKGRLAFAEDIQNEFESYRQDVTNFDVSVAVNEDAGEWIDVYVKEQTPADLFKLFRDVTGRDTDDVDHASAVIYSAAHTIWEALAGDYQTYLTEQHEDDEPTYVEIAGVEYNRYDLDAGNFIARKS